MPHSNGRNEWLVPKGERPSPRILGDGYLRTFNLAMIALIAAAVVVIAFVAIAVLGKASVPAVERPVGAASEAKRTSVKN